MSLIGSRLVKWLSGLRFPYLAAIAGVLFLINVVVPDAIPFVDEILLGLGTALFASWRKREPEPGKDESAA